MTMPLRYSADRSADELASAGGRFNAMSDRIARRDAAAVSAADLLSILQDNATNQWKPPGGGYLGALTHDVIHGLDITVPLGIGQRVPADRLRAVLQALAAPQALNHLGTAPLGVHT